LELICEFLFQTLNTAYEESDPLYAKMFVLTEMKDTVRIQPSLFNLDANEAIVNVLNQKFANKV